MLSNFPSNIIVGLIAFSFLRSNYIDAAGPSSGPFGCLRPRTDESDDEETVREQRKDVDIASMTVAYQVIEQHLRSEVHSEDVNANLLEVTRLMYDELQARVPERSGIFSCTRPRSRPPLLSGRLESMDYQRGQYSDQDVMTNALRRLVDLQKVYESGFACSADITHILDENNRIASDPISRHGDINALGRIDSMILVTALRRAQKCTRRYRDKLRSNSQVRDLSRVWMKNCWNKILQHRLKKENIDRFGSSTDSIIELYPRETLDFFMRNPIALVQDEIDLLIPVFEQAKTSWSPDTGSDLPEGPNSLARDFDRFLHRPCRAFIHDVEYEFESMEFDLQFRNLISSSVFEDLDSDAGKLTRRAYYRMCVTLVNQRRQTEDLIAGS